MKYSKVSKGKKKEQQGPSGQHGACPSAYNNKRKEARESRAKKEERCRVVEVYRKSPQGPTIEGISHNEG